MSFIINQLLAAAGNEAFEDAPVPEPIAPVDPIVPVDPVDLPPADPIAPVDHIEPVVPAEPVVPVEPVAVVEPVVPVEPEVIPVVVVDPVDPVPPSVDDVVPVEPVVVVDTTLPVDQIPSPEPEPAPVDPIDVANINAAVAAVVEAEAELAEATGANTLAVLDGELASDERLIEEANSAVVHIQEVSAGIEHFMEAGHLSANTAVLLQQSINSAMGSVGKDGREVMSGGLEAFGDDPDQMLIVLGAGLLELEEEQTKTKGKAMAALKSVVATIGKFVTEALSQAKRHRAKATELSSAISGKPQKDVSISSSSLMVGKGFSTNLPADLVKFKDKLMKASHDAIGARAAWYFKTAPGILANINSAETADAAVAAAAKFQVPALKGATVNVRDEGDTSLKRTEVVLGNYALFELAVKASAPTDTASAVEFLRATAKSRINIQRAKTQPPEAETVSMNEATARKVITACEAILTEAESLKGVVDSLSKQTLELDANGSASGDKDVKKIASAASALPDGLVETVSQLPRTATRAAFDVVEAALAVVSSFAKGEKAAKAEKKDNKEEQTPPKDDKSGKGEGEEE